MSDLARVLLSGAEDRPLRLVYGVASGDNTVAVRGADTAVELPAIIPVRSGDYCAVLESGADRVIVGPIGEALTLTDRLTISRPGAADDEAIRLNGGGADGTAAGTQPFISFYGGSDANRAGYVGFPNVSTDALNLVAEKGNLALSGVGGITAANGLQVNGGNLTVQDGHRVVSQETYDVTTVSAANMFVTSNGFFARSTSSSRYKTDVEDLDDEHADLALRLRPVWFRSTAGEDDPEHSHYGLIAEEVAEIDPRLVQWGESEDGEPQADGVQYDRLVVHLLSIVRRLQDRVETLERRAT